MLTANTTQGKIAIGNLINFLQVDFLKAQILCIPNSSICISIIWIVPTSLF